MSAFDHWEKLRYTFFSICLVATIALNIICIYQYVLNKDLCEVNFKQFNADEDLIYASASLCISNQFIAKKMVTYGKGINVTTYRIYLIGDYWDPRMLYINYDDVTFPMIANLLEYGAQYPNWTWFWYNQEHLPPGAWNNPYISYRDADCKCFAMDIPYHKGMHLLRFGIRIRSNIFPGKVRPRQLREGKEGFLVVLHYPQQFVRSYFAGLGKWNWPPRKARENYAMDIIVKNINVIIRRNKPKQGAPCDNDWRMYDSSVWERDSRSWL